MSERICTGCRRALPLESFAVQDSSTGKRHPRCRDCVREYSHRHYVANRTAYIDRAKGNNRELVARKRELVAELRRRPCADCGGTFPECCMQFDHRQGRSITGRNSPEAIANMQNSNGSFELLVAELTKCDLLCANCHCIRTHARREAGS